MRILISAYACEPGKGSEPGAGWNWTLAAARNHEVWVLTRANNRAAIEEALACDPQPSLHFVYVDLPSWARFWKRGQRGVRLYYALWQVLAGIEARRLHTQQRFDIVHHLTFANLWYPALVFLADAPFVLGPVGGGPRVPLRLYRSLGVSGRAREISRVTAYAVSRANPLVRAAWRRATVIVVQNDETREALPRRYRGKTVVRPNACVRDGVTLPRRRTYPVRPVAVYAGRLLGWKGVSLAIRALEFAPRWDLLVVGQGPDRDRLVEAVRTRNLEGRVRFVPWLTQEALWHELASCHALVLPSLRDDSPLIAAEAQSLGLPVVAFDQGGPSVFARLPGTSFELVYLGSEEECIRGLASALNRLERLEVRMPAEAFGLQAVARDVDAVYERAGTAVRPTIQAAA